MTPAEARPLRSKFAFAERLKSSRFSSQPTLALSNPVRVLAVTLPEAKQKTVLAELAKRRDHLRGALLDRAKPLIAELAKKKGAKVVLEKGTVLWADPGIEEITRELIARVDGQGPLKV